MAEQPSGAQANAPVTDEGAELAQEYDKNRDERVAARDESDEIGEGRKYVGNGGAVVTGEGGLGMESKYVGQGDLSDVEYVLAAKGLEGKDDEDNDVESNSSWTAQSARPFVDELAVPGQTFTLDELPDPAVVTASNLPAHSIPAGLVVDAEVTDSLNTSQERGGDSGTSPKAKGNKREVARANRDKSPDRNAADGLANAESSSK